MPFCLWDYATLSLHLPVIYQQLTADILVWLGTIISSCSDSSNEKIYVSLGGGQRGVGTVYVFSRSGGRGGGFAVFHPFQQYFSQIIMMGE